MISAISRPQYKDVAEGKANVLRSELGHGTDAIGDIFELLEHLGIQVVRWPMEENGPDGFYVSKGNLTLIAINSDKRLVRQRFTAAHELAHHLFDGKNYIDLNVLGGKTIPEMRANSFAAFFLMPRDGVTRWLGQNRKNIRHLTLLDANSIIHLSRHFMVSYEATLYQLHELGLLQRKDLEALRKEQPDKLSRRLGYDVESEYRAQGVRILARDFIKRAYQAYSEGDISLTRLAELLRTDKDTASQLVAEAGIEPREVTLEDLIEETRRTRLHDPEEKAD